MATSVPFSALLAPKANPRRAFDQKAIEGLAQSIKRDGVLQNLVVRPEGKGEYRVVIGKRRYLALKHLSDRGDIERGYRVPIRLAGDKASKADLDRIATVENVQREALDPVDEAEAFALLLTKGAKIEDVSAETGISVPTIRRRVALADLAPEVKEAVRVKALPLSLAEALTLAPQAEQMGLLKEIKRHGHIDARQLRAHILDEKPTLATAIFSVEQYKGTVTKDLFAEKETTYFDDREQFMALQKEAVETQAESLRKEFAWVEVATDQSVPWWQYREAKGKEPRGAIVHLAPSGRVEVRKNLVKQEVDPTVTKPERKKDKQRANERPTYSKPTLRYVNAHKTLALQMVLMENSRKAKEAAAVLLLGGSRGAAISLKAHDALRELTKHPGSSSAYEFIDTCASKLLAKLGLRSEGADGVSSWSRLHHAGMDWTQVIAGVQSLTLAELDALVALVVIVCLGTDQMEGVEPDHTFFSGLAKDLALDMRKVWTPDVIFLSGLRKDDLLKIASECGAARKHSGLPKASKKELVATLASFFKRTADPKATLDEHDAKGRTWLPDCMRMAKVGLENVRTEAS